MINISSNNSVFSFDVVRPVIHRLKMLRYWSTSETIKTVVREAERQTDKLSYKLFLQAYIEEIKSTYQIIDAHLEVANNIALTKLTGSDATLTIEAIAAIRELLSDSVKEYIK